MALPKRLSHPILLALLVSLQSPAHGQNKEANKSNDPVPGTVGKENLIYLKEGKLPAYLKVEGKPVFHSTGGLALLGQICRTEKSDFFKKDFTFDVLFRFPENDRNDSVIGIGAARYYGGGLHQDDAVWCDIRNPVRGGIVLLVATQRKEEQVGKIESAGPHMFRIQKRGNVLSVAVKLNFTDKFSADMERTIPDFKKATPFLNDQNAYLFAGNGLIVDAVRLVADGATTDLQATAPTTTGKTPDGKSPKITGKVAVDLPEVLGKKNLLFLNGPKLPSYFQNSPDLPYDPKAGMYLKGRFWRTVKSDFFKKDFTFDVLFHFLDNEKGEGLIGIGGGRAYGGALHQDNAVWSRLRAPANGGDAILTATARGVQLMGKLPTAGPYLYRLQKRGDSLTAAICTGFTDKFVPDQEQTIADFKAATPFLNDQNGYLFIGDAINVDAVRLVVEGEPIETRDIALSLPPAILEGKPFRQQALKGAGSARISMDAPPKGLSISPTGDLTWTPTPTQIGKHPLRFLVKNDKSTQLVLTDLLVVSADDAKAVKGDLTKIEALYKFPLAGEDHQVSLGLNGRSLLLLNGDKLQRLGGQGTIVLETVKLTTRYKRIAEREGYFVGLSDQKKALHLIDKKTGEVKKSIQMDYAGRNDLALHPSKPTSYVCVNRSGKGVHDVILIVDERTGDVLEPTKFYGTWAVVSPNGDELYAGYREVYQTGSTLLFNPDQIYIVPEYGTFDALLVYDITREKPVLVRAKQNPGGNGNGILLSPDGKRLSYFSHTGYPGFSGNIPGFDPENFDKRPVSYPCKDNKATAQWLVHHTRLPIAAAPTEKGVVCFDRDSGEVQAARVDLNSYPLGDVKIIKCWFSPDGRNLLVECEEGKQRYLQRVKLKLTAAELALLSN